MSPGETSLWEKKGRFGLVWKWVEGKNLLASAGGGQNIVAGDSSKGPLALVLVMGPSGNALEHPVALEKGGMKLWCLVLVWELAWNHPGWMRGCGMGEGQHVLELGYWLDGSSG